MTKNLRCPCCGGGINVEIGSVGFGYMSYDTAVGFWCDNNDCNAEWNIDGEMTVPSALTTGPESVD